MSFHDVVFNDGLIMLDAEGGPMFRTDIARQDNGSESRNIEWDEALGSWNLGDVVVDETELVSRQKFFRARKARAHSFKWKDWGDYQCAITEGVLAAHDTSPPNGLGAGVPTYDLWKAYGDAGGSDYERIYKPASVTQVTRGGSPVTVGAGAGQIAVDLATGRVTWVADATANASSITPGATTQVVLASNPGTLTAGQRLYLSGFTGADAALVNDLAHVINTVTGSGPFTFTLATDTTGKTITLGSGQGRKYPQATEALAWAGEFYKAVRFDTDHFRYTFRAIDAPSGKRLFDLLALPIVMDRNPLA